MYAQDYLENEAECVGVENLKYSKSKGKEGVKNCEPRAKAKVARYNLALPAQLMTEIQSIADSECTTVLEVIRKFIKLGLVAVNAQRNNGRIILDQDGEKTIITML